MHEPLADLHRAGVAVVLVTYEAFGGSSCRLTGDDSSYWRFALDAPLMVPPECHNSVVEFADVDPENAAG